MRTLLFFMIVLLNCSEVDAQKKLSKAATVAWLQENVKNGEQGGKAKSTHRNTTSMFRDISKYKPNGDFTAKDFKGKIESIVSWKPDELDIQNNIFENGQLKETYTYQIPTNAITGASVTNCKRNGTDEVNAYNDRPIFVQVKNQTTRIGHTRYYKNGKVKGSPATQYSMNNKDCDWNSAIPIAGNWDDNSKLQEQVLQAFYRLGELN